MEILTERLKLRLWKPEDLEPFAKLNADEEVMECFPKTLTKEESDAFVEVIQREFIERGYGLFAVEAVGVAPFIGFIGLHLADFEADFTPCVEIGWRLAKEHWGKGYATEGGKAVLAFAASKRIKEIFSFTAKINLRSIGVMEKLGLEKVGEFDHPKLDSESPLQRHVLYHILLA